MFTKDEKKKDIGGIFLGFAILMFGVLGSLQVFQSTIKVVHDAEDEPHEARRGAANRDRIAADGTICI